MCSEKNAPQLLHPFKCRTRITVVADVPKKAQPSDLIRRQVFPLYHDLHTPKIALMADLERLVMRGSLLPHASRLAICLRVAFRAGALSIYRRTFQPSERLAKPYVMMAAGVCAAPTDDEAAFLRSSQLLAFARLRTGRPGKLPHPTRDLNQEIPAPVMAQVQHALSCSATGSAATVRRQLQSLLDTFQPDELIVTGMIHDHAARVRSFEIAAEVLGKFV